jgi:hypothetical protein
MECLMDSNKHERFLAANEELQDFLQHVEGLAGGICSISDRDLQRLSQHLSTLAPEIGDASRGETLDAGLQNEIAKYVSNLRALQIALEKVRCVMLARRMQIERQRRHLDGLQGWVNAYNQTT